MTLLLAIVAYTLGVSFFCSLLEAALFSSRTTRVMQKRDAGSRGAAFLLEIKEKKLDDAISSVLILNTLANSLGAVLAGAQAGKLFGDVGVGIFTGFLTLAILLGSEIVPKTLGAVYADLLTPFVGWALRILAWLMAPILFLSRSLTRLLVREQASGPSRSDLAAMVDMAAREGALSGDESVLFANVLGAREIRVEDVMTPRTVCVMLPETTTIQELVNDRAAQAFSRIPLYRENRDNVLGYVLQRDLLSSLARGGRPDQPLRDFLRPIDFLPESATAAAAFRRFRGRREHLAMVSDEHGGIAGLVTLEDITETLLGIEIVDESDHVADLRQLATRLRDERLARLE
jgi:CBS domain containing-hemolysin-like protein